jgi:hypothetical protein
MWHKADMALTLSGYLPPHFTIRNQTGEGAALRTETTS